MVIFICGNVGTGKTTIAKRLAKKFNFYYLEGDRYKKSLFRADPHFSRTIRLGHPFPARTKALLYKLLIKKFAALSGRYSTIIVDETLHTRQGRDLMFKNAKKYFQNYLIIKVLSPEPQVKKRFQKTRRGHFLQIHQHPYKIHRLIKQRESPLAHVDLIIKNDGTIQKVDEILFPFIKSHLT